MTIVQTRQPDTGVKLPEAVQRAAARAAELSEKQRADRIAQMASSETPRMAIVDVNSAAPPIAPSPTPASEPAPASALAPVPTPTPDRQPTEQDFKAMQGRYEKSEKEKRDLINRVNEMTRVLATVQTPLPAVPGRGDVTFNIPTSGKLVKPEEIEEFTPKFLDMVGRRAQEIAEPQVAALRQEIEQLKRSIGGVQQNAALTAQQEVFRGLDGEVPDWRQQNDDQGFKQWLSQPDPIFGAPRQVALNDAFNTGQTSRVVAAFKSYKAELAALSPAQTRRSSSGNGAESLESNQHPADAGNSQSNPATTPAVDLMSLAAPGRARSGQQPTSPDKSIVTRAEIAQFYTEVQKGRYAGRENDKIAIENMIFEAQKEGRIR